MATSLKELIKEGNLIKNSIYADNGGGFYATYLFSDHNKYIKWAINSIRFIESNFPKDENYIKFKDIVEIIDENVTPIEFNKLLFILEYYNTSLEEKTNDGVKNNGLEQILNSIKVALEEKEFKELEMILKDNNINQAKSVLIEKLNSFSTKKLSEMLASILLNTKK
ncbi:MAG: hypothetical protein KA273_05005 [Bacteroidales bacterium]|nr:hypothetical protein [Bacteroidales bacterium]